MKTSAKALFLSLLSLLLIIAAAAIFLLLARGRLLAEIEAQSTAVAARDESVAERDAALATMTAEQEALAATATIGANELQSELDQAQGEIESLTSTLGETEDALAANSQALTDAQATLEAATLIPPQIITTGPSDDAIFLPDEPIPFTAFVTDEDGLTTIQVLVNDEVIQVVNANAERQRTVPVSISGSVEGPLQVKIVAEDVYGNVREITAFSVIVRDYVAENRAILTEIGDNVSILRGIEREMPLPTNLLNESQLVAQQVENLDLQLAGDVTRVDPVVWRAFDFVDEAYVFDLEAVYNADVATSTTAIYDPRLEVILLREPTDTLDPLTRWALVGAYARGVLDSFVDLNPVDRGGLSRDEVLARLLVIEGDVVTVQREYVAQGLFPENVARSLPPEPPRIGGEAPTLLLGPLPFPYEAGESFVTGIFEESGWEGVNGLYDAPPLSSEQVLHPERYEAGDRPVELTLPTPTLSPTWQLRERESLGEYLLRLYLAQHMPQNIALEAAAGWGGDRYAVYWNQESDQVALLWDLVWDEPEDVEGFAGVFAGFAAARDPGATPVVEETGSCWIGAEDVLCLGGTDAGRLRIVRAPDIEMAETLLTAGSDEAQASPGS